MTVRAVRLLAVLGGVAVALGAPVAHAHWEADPPRHRTGYSTWTPQIDLPTSWDTALGYAATVWDNVSFQCHDFGVRPRGTSASIVIDRYYIDGPGLTLGYNNGVHTSIVFDSGEQWHLNVNTAPPSNALDLWGVAAHEFGHTLALEHMSSPNTMHRALSYGSTAYRSLEGGDVAGIRDLYPSGSC